MVVLDKARKRVLALSLSDILIKSSSNILNPGQHDVIHPTDAFLINIKDGDAAAVIMFYVFCEPKTKHTQHVDNDSQH
jgi:hypothetical protein